MPKRIFIHAGFGKCASTWLQTEIFPRLREDYTYFGSGSNVLTELIKIINNLSVKYEKNNNISIENEKTYLWSLLNKSCKNDLIVISGEFICGHQSNCHFRFDIRCRIIKLLFNDPKFIFIIRKQDDILFSAWNQGVKSGNPARNGCIHSLNRYLSWKNTDIKKLYGVKPLSYRQKTSFICYDYYSLFMQAFDKCELSDGSVSIVPFELLQSNPKIFLTRILSQIGLSDNAIENIFCQASLNKKNSGIGKEMLYGVWAINRILLFIGIDEGWAKRREVAFANPERYKFSVLLAFKMQSCVLSFFHMIKHSKFLKKNISIFIFILAFTKLVNMKEDTKMMNYISNYYNEKNAKLQLIVDEDLKALGYYR